MKLESNERMSEEDKIKYEIEKDNGTWVDEAVYLICNIQQTIYLLLSVLIVLICIGRYEYADTKEIVMFILGSNAGMITNQKTEK